MRVANYVSIKAMSLDEITQRLSVMGKKKIQALSPGPEHENG